MSVPVFSNWGMCETVVDTTSTVGYCFQLAAIDATDSAMPNGLLGRPR